MPIKTFGLISMMLGAIYLIGTLVNRCLITRYKVRVITIIGFAILGLSVFLYLLLSIMLQLSELGLLIPSLPMAFSIGLIFPNILGQALKIFPNSIGISAAAQSMLFMFFCTVLNSITSHMQFQKREAIALFYLLIFCAQIFLYLKYILKKD